MDPKVLGARLKELREGVGLTQKELAAKAALSQRAISHWEQGLREPGWSNVLALAEALGVDCLAFQQLPADVSERPRGRPRKDESPSGEQPSTPTAAKRFRKRKEK
jgi:transcriptional regulator with XRE-family HTH domain